MKHGRSYFLGLVGHPVGHSLSPPMHEAALAEIGAQGGYELIDLKPEELGSGVADLKARGFAGFNVTIPYKQKLVNLCDTLTAEARKVRAVNTVRIEDGAKLTGHNTDIGGFASALADVLPGACRFRVAFVLGSGGAARAAVWALVAHGWPRIGIVARNLDRAYALVQEVNAHSLELDPPVELPRFELAGTMLTGLTSMPDLIVNCTSIGLAGEVLPDWLSQLLNWINPEGVVFDMVYSRRHSLTPLVRDAQRLRLKCCDGTGMLIQQAALSFQFWTGKTVAPGVFRAALEKARGARSLPL